MDESGLEPVRALGTWIRALRTMRGLTQEDLAQQAGIDPGLLGIIERGERNWGVAHIWPIAHALDIPVSDLFPADEQPRIPGPRSATPRVANPRIAGPRVRRAKRRHGRE